MGDHDAPESWLQKWRDSEPVRLYLWSVAAAVLLAALTAGWLTQELYVALTGVAASVLMLGGAAAARREAFAPATVERLAAQEYETGWGRGRARGWQAAMDDVGARLPATAEHRAAPADRPTPAPRDTNLIPRQGPETTPRAELPLCGYVESGRRCQLHQHPAGTPHALGGPV